MLVLCVSVRSGFVTGHYIHRDITGFITSKCVGQEVGGAAQHNRDQDAGHRQVNSGQLGPAQTDMQCINNLYLLFVWMFSKVTTAPVPDSVERMDD